MHTVAGFIVAPPKLRLTRQTSWKLALIAGFVAQLLLILFVTTIGLQQLGVTTQNLNTVVDVHMRKQELTNKMVISARDRTLIMFMLTKIEDPFDRDALLMEFNTKGSEFVAARQALLSLPLNDQERDLIRQQQRFIGIAQPIHDRVIDLTNAGRVREAENVTISEAIPAQDKVMKVLSQLDAEAQRVALEASLNAHEAHRVARFWMYLLSGAALVAGLFVAAAVFRHTNRVSREREDLAIHDALTGLPNRMLFMDRLEQSLKRARRRKTMVGVMFIDLDRFKRVNDTLGHASGDQLICQVARRLRAAARAEDIVARLGGDEFVVVIADVGEVGHILLVVEKMLAAMAAPYLISGHELFCSCSIGVSVYPNDGIDSGSLLKNADTAMYHAKSAGRNRFQLYDAAMNAMAGERLQLETDLHYALERDEFVLHYQPQIDLETGRIHAVEALVRWNHPEKGLLGPGTFLEMLEETGEIVSVGRKLLLAACRQTARWHAVGFSGLHVAVNISSKEFWHASLLDNVRAALAESGLPAPSLQLELTEGIFMKDIDLAAARIQALKAQGITVAVDDFGTGYSSLAHLKRFPLDVLKIDRYFVEGLEETPINRGLIRSILALCQGLHLEAVAEGVETSQQLDYLRGLGCRIAQGDFISRPVPATQMTALLCEGWRQTRCPA